MWKAAWYNGLGNFSPSQVVERAQRAKLDAVIVKYGYPNVERALTDAGIGWGTERYVYPSQPISEATMLANAVDAGAKFVVINAEVEWEYTTGEPMAQLIYALRHRHPHIPIYACTDTRGNRLSLPYQQVLAEHCQGWMPMVYPKAFYPAMTDSSVGWAFRDSLTPLALTDIPIFPAIQTYDNIGPDAVREQVEYCELMECSGYSAYTIEHATEAEWEVLCMPNGVEGGEHEVSQQVRVNKMNMLLAASCLAGDFEKLVKQLKYLRVIA